MEVRRLNSEDLDAIVKIHSSAFPDFFLTALGARFLTKYYSFYLDDKHVALVCIDGVEIMGFAVGSHNIEEFYCELSNRKMYFLPSILLNVFNWQLWSKIFKRAMSIIFKKRVNDDKVNLKGYCELTSIGVSADHQNKGVGKTLLNAFEVVCFESECAGIYLTTDQDNNESVIEFYKRSGYDIFKEFKQGKSRVMLIMKKDKCNKTDRGEDSDLMPFIPYALPLTDENEINEVIDTIRSGWLTTGPKTKQFEKDFSEFVQAKYALAVNSATAGLHLGLEALGVGAGDKVITTVHTFTATAEVIRYLGADPVFVDIEGDSFNIDCDEVEAALIAHPEAKVIMPVHYAGQSANMTRIMALAEQYKVKVLEDAAHAVPTTHQGKIIGTFGDITVYSFYANKTITTGEGGMLVTNNEEYAKRVSCMRLHGISKDVFDRFTSTKPSWHYQVVAPGFKYNMTDIAASLGIHQLKKAWQLQERRKEIANKYSNAFNDLPVVTPLIINEDDVHSWHLYVLQLNIDEISISRDRFIEILAEKGICTSVHYIPLHFHPYWQETYSLSKADFPRSSKAFTRIVSLPNYPKMTDEQVDKVISVVRNVLKEYRLSA
ncbi:GNAT family N-acetyltransferase [Aliikangiella maris]|uniref:GNAT family N-acetyltransferase n=2 Tax=Aliikangiella maris TaxID=3162458 RepID=A0ABV3MHY2_9GAMM